MNKIKWAMVFQTKYPYQAEIVIQVLKKNFIDSVPHNKIDSSYNNFGYYEVLLFLLFFFLLENIIKYYMKMGLVQISIWVCFYRF